jgi:hypothetical protein
MDMSWYRCKYAMLVKSNAARIRHYITLNNFYGFAAKLVIKKAEGENSGYPDRVLQPLAQTYARMKCMVSMAFERILYSPVKMAHILPGK